MVPIARPNASRLRYHVDCGNIMKFVYIDREGYTIQHPQRRNMFEDGEHRGYGRASHRYVTN